MIKNTLKDRGRMRKLVKVNITGLLDKVLVFGYYEGRDDYGQHKIRIKKLFCIGKFHEITSNIPILKYFLVKTHRVMWEGRTDEWKMKPGEVLLLKDSDEEIIEESDAEELKDHEKMLNDLRQKRGWFSSVLG